MKKNNFLKICLITMFLFIQNANTANQTEEDLVAAINLENVKVPQTLSYLNGKLKLFRINNPNEFINCPYILRNLEQNTQNCLCLLYQLRPKFIWKHQEDKCHILITIKKIDNQLECNIENLCSQYHYDSCSFNENVFHFCNSGISDTIHGEEYLDNIENLINDFIASTLCFMIGFFKICISRYEDHVNRFVDFEKNVFKRFLLLECGDILEYEDLAECQNQELITCPNCHAEKLYAIKSFSETKISQETLELIKNKKIPAPML